MVVAVVVTSLAFALFVLFWIFTWWAAFTAAEDGREHGNSPASWNWFYGQVAMGVGVTISVSPVVWRFFIGEPLPDDVRSWVGFLAMLTCVVAKWRTQRAFAIHRDAARYRDYYLFYNESRRERKMGQLAKAGLTQLVDVVDTSTAAFIEAVDATKDAGAASAQAAINVGDKTLETAIDEAKKLREQYMASIRRIANALGDALPA
jgi:hypothetical protein